ncbi:unnamed protein product [Boreogadus saida]
MDTSSSLHVEGHIRFTIRNFLQTSIQTDLQCKFCRDEALMSRCGGGLIWEDYRGLDPWGGPGVWTHGAVQGSGPVGRSRGLDP